MKITDVKIGQRYIAKVSGNLTAVRVLAIRTTYSFGGRAQPAIDVVNERTGRRTTFRSAAKLRRAVTSEKIFDPYTRALADRCNGPDEAPEVPGHE